MHAIAFGMSEEIPTTICIFYMREWLYLQILILYSFDLIFYCSINSDLLTFYLPFKNNEVRILMLFLLIPGQLRMDSSI